jgi:prevent-host-death family protein
MGIREAKAKLSAVVSRVRAGETIVLTDRGRPVARVVPIAKGEAPLADRLAALEARGWIGAGAREPVSLPPVLVSEEAGVAQRYLAEDRDAG